MIELAQIKSTDKLGQLQGILNTAFNEIQTDQGIVGQCINVSAQAEGKLNTLITAFTVSNVTNDLNAIVFPESNGVFIARLTGRIVLKGVTSATLSADHIRLDIPAVKAPSRAASTGTFVTPDHLGLNATVSGQTFFPCLVSDDSNIQGPYPANACLVQNGAQCDVLVYLNESISNAEELSDGTMAIYF